MPPIAFGTDGWRARIGEDYTFENVRRCAQGVAEWVIASGMREKGVVVGYDRRFASEHFAQAAAEVLLAHDIPVALPREAMPTQMASYLVVEQGFACGVVITASHNPWTDNGFKVKSPTGAAADAPILAAIEAGIRRHAAGTPPVRPLADAEAAGMVARPEPFAGYARFVARTLDLDALRAAPMRVLVDPLHGSGAGWIPRLLAGGRIVVDEIHAERNPWFGGVNPEPIRPNIDAALATIARDGYDLGLLLDGDADRSGAADETGTFIHQLQVMGLLMYYLLEHRGLRAPVVSTINETAMVGRLGGAYGVPVHETPVGFKYVGPKMIETGAMMGGEESGGYGFGMHLPERDALFAALLLLEALVEGGVPLGQRIDALQQRCGGASHYDRLDLRLPDMETRARLEARLAEAPPAEVAGVAVQEVISTDGVKLRLGPSHWLMLRFSGTEPLLRLYCEAPDAARVAEVLGWARQLAESV